MAGPAPKRGPWRAIATLLVAALSGGCATHQQYRTDYVPCRSAAPENECGTSALQQHRRPGDASDLYQLGFIEFDDQGQLWDRQQMRSVLDALFEQAATDDLLLVVFVHGWKHGAAAGDSNIEMLRRNLIKLGELEKRIGALTGEPPRKVAGLYLAWRGGSVTTPGVKELSFWERKETAHKVGSGGVTEVLSRLELLKTTRDTMAKAEASSKDEIVRSRTRLVVVGHSFGGAVVFSALSQLLENRFVQTVGPAGFVSAPRGYGDLVVLINPAFEAMRYATLSDMATERASYFPQQLPVLAVLTSEADMATKVAFPIGRYFSTLFEKERIMRRANGLTDATEQIDQGKANVTAVGHFEPYRTHTLRSAGPAVSAPSIESDVRRFLHASSAWEQDTPGSVIEFEGSVLQRTQTSAGRNPYLVIQVSGDLIPDHNRIDDERVTSFLRQLILIAAQSDDPAVRQQLRSLATKP